MVEPYDGMAIRGDTSFAPGVYYLPQGLTVTADDLTVEGHGALLVGAGRGQGITVRGRKGVTLRGVRLAHYDHGINAEDCTGLSVIACQVRSTSELAPNSAFLDIWRPVERAYGGGILLHRVREARIEGNDLQHQQTGLLCYACEQLVIRDNVANHCSGFGFHLFATCDSLLEGNYADFCCRYEPRGGQTGHLGADAAGFLIVHGSCRNRLIGNYARLGGDGFFLAGLRPDWTHVPCNDNLFERNDGSHSPNIAFEATFSRGNMFRRNRADACNYGFWLGFSSQTTLDRNTAHANRRAAVAVENGVHCTVRENVLSAGPYGVLLWSRYVAPFAMAVPDNATSHTWLIEANRMSEFGVAVRIAADQDHGVRSLPIGTPACPRPHNHRLRHNTFRNNQLDLELIGVEEPILEANSFDQP